VDNLTPEQRSRNMRAIKSKNTKIEVLLRKQLFKKGYRYRINYKKIVGKPDIVFVSQKVAIFCDSEFWHGKNWKTTKHKIKSNTDYWHNKIESNILRDRRNNKILKKNGWKVLRFWGKEIENNYEGCIKKIDNILKAN
jgi:DNA mismatch endonuclease (patch repair protein)